MMNDKPQVLVIEDIRETLSDYLRNLQSDEYQLTGVRTLDEALTALDQQDFDVVVTDLKLFDQSDGGMQVIRTAKSRDATTGVIVVTGFYTPANAQRAMSELGARTVLGKPLDYADCRQRIHEAINERRYRQAVIEAAGQDAFIPIRSPYIAGKPLGRRNLMFYGRDQVFDFIRENVEMPLQQNHLALIGPRRIGKTSILRQLPTRLEPSTLPVYINCQSLGIDPGMPAFFLRFSRQIRRSLQTQNIDVSDLHTLTKADLGGAPSLAFSDIFLAQLWRVLADRSLVLCLDEFEELEGKVQRGRLDPGVFDFLHELMLTQEKITSILVGTRYLEELEGTSHEAASILELVAFRRIEVLTPDLARQLIEEPVAYSGMYYEEEAIERFQQATGGYPYLIQLLCGRLVNRRNEQKRNGMTLEDIEAVITKVVEGPELGFFWKTLAPHQQAVLIAVCQFARNGETFIPPDIEAQLQAFNLSYQDWPRSVVHLLHELTLEELLREQIIGGQTPQYIVAFDLLGDWVRRHKAIDQIREDINSDR